MKYAQEIVLKEDIKAKMERLMAMPGEQIYEEYGFKRDEAIIHTAKFPNGYEADIKLVVCEEDTPYVDPVLFDPNGYERCVLEPGFDSYCGEYYFEDGLDEYVVTIS